MAAYCKGISGDIRPCYCNFIVRTCPLFVNGDDISPSPTLCERRPEMGKFVLKRASNQQFHWTLVANNGETIGQSETYTTKQGALNGIASCRSNAPYDARYDVFVGRDNQHYWRLKASNGQIVCQSEGYVSRQGALNGVDACKRIAPSATIEDRT